MQFAFITLFLLFIVLPGIFFRLGYLKRDGLVIVSGTKLYIEIIFVIVLSLIYHFFFWWFFECLNWYDFDTPLFYNLLIGRDIDLGNNELAIRQFILYNIILSIVSFFIGWIVNNRLTASDFRFWPNFQFLDYTGHWDRILSLDAHSLDSHLDNKKSSVSTQIDALLEINGDAYIYSGVLRNYYIDPKGYIDKIILDDVTRMKVSEYDEMMSKLDTEEKKPEIGDIEQDEIEDEAFEEMANLLDQDLTHEQFEIELEKILGNEEFVLEYFGQKIMPSNHFVMYGSTIKNLNIHYAITNQEDK